jgi:histidine triad (HIT) family protein
MSFFSKIISKEIPAAVIAEDDNFIAFLDIAPLVRGHVLVVPKIEVDKIFEVSDEVLSRMLVFAKPIAKAIEQAFYCIRCGFAVVGLEVAHAHMHLVPIQSADDLNFTRAKLIVSPKELVEDLEKIKNYL